MLFTESHLKARIQKFLVYFTDTIPVTKAEKVRIQRKCESQMIQMGQVHFISCC